MYYTVDIKDYFDRDNLLDQLKDAGQDLLEQTVKEAVTDLLEDLGLPSVSLQISYDVKNDNGNSVAIIRHRILYLGELLTIIIFFLLHVKFPF